MKNIFIAEPPALTLEPAQFLIELSRYTDPSNITLRLNGVDHQIDYDPTDAADAIKAERQFEAFDERLQDCSLRVFHVNPLSENRKELTFQVWDSMETLTLEFDEAFGPIKPSDIEVKILSPGQDIPCLVTQMGVNLPEPLYLVDRYQLTESEATQIWELFGLTEATRVQSQRQTWSRTGLVAEPAFHSQYGYGIASWSGKCDGYIVQFDGQPSCIVLTKVLGDRLVVVTTAGDVLYDGHVDGAPSWYRYVATPRDDPQKSIVCGAWECDSHWMETTGYNPSYVLHIRKDGRELTVVSLAGDNGDDLSLYEGWIEPGELLGHDSIKAEAICTSSYHNGNKTFPYAYTADHDISSEHQEWTKSYLHLIDEAKRKKLFATLDTSNPTEGEYPIWDRIHGLLSENSIGLGSIEYAFKTFSYSSSIKRIASDWRWVELRHVLSKANEQEYKLQIKAIASRLLSLNPEGWCLK